VEEVEEVRYRGEKKRVLGSWMQEMMRERHVIKLSPEEVEKRPTQFWVRSFLSWSGGKWRQVFDLSSLNKHLYTPTFQQSSLRRSMEDIAKASWAFKSDASRMFWHIPVNPKWRAYLRFKYKGEIFECVSMPLGLSIAPWICNELMSRVHLHLSSLGVKALFYVDDWLILGMSEKEVYHSSRIFLSEMAEFGIHLNPAKTSEVPSQFVQFLGVDFDLARKRIIVPTSKLRDLERASSRLLAQSEVTARQLQSFLGKTNFISIATVWARLKTDSLTRWRNTLWKKTSNWDSSAVLSEEARAELAWWKSLKKRFMFGELDIGVGDQETVRLETDAGPIGWGARWMIRTRGREWNGSFGEFSQRMKKSSSNARELTTLLFVLRRNGKEWRRRVVHWTTDSVVAAAYVRRIYGSAPHLSKTSILIHKLLWRWKVRLKIHVVKGEEIQEVDRLSRLLH
jgi:hypothetical protein